MDGFEKIMNACNFYLFCLQFLTRALLKGETHHKNTLYFVILLYYCVGFVEEPVEKWEALRETTVMLCLKITLKECYNVICVNSCVACFG